MGWLTVYNSTNKINDSKREYEEALHWRGLTWTRTITTEEYRYVGMTEATADTAFAAINNPPSVVAVKEKENAAGAYTLAVTEITETSWSL